MKFTKILLATALCASFYACNQEEDVIISPDTAVTLKADSLENSEVEKLTDYSYRLSQTPEFTTMRAKVADFNFNMNYNFDSDWESREDLEDWLSNNLSMTQFNSVAEGVAAFDEAGEYTKAFYGGNRSFFASVLSGTPGQIAVILEPITINPTTPVATTSCDDDCFEAYDNSMQQAFNGWVADLDFADLMGGGDYWYEDAEINYSAHSNAAENALWDCFDACDE